MNKKLYDMVSERGPHLKSIRRGFSFLREASRVPVAEYSMPQFLQSDLDPLCVEKFKVR